jgi:ABC-2 type transport system permease protein
MNAFFALIRKDLRLYFSNRRAVAINIALPLVIAAFFGALFGGGSSQKTIRVPVAVVDLDQSRISKAIATGLAGEKMLDVQLLDQTAALDLVRKGKIRAALVMPAHFGDDAKQALFTQRNKPALAVHYDPSQSMTLAMLNGMLMQYVMKAVIQTASDPAEISSTFGDFRKSIADAKNMDEDAKRDLNAMFDSIEKVQKPSASRPKEENAAATRAGFNFSPPFTTTSEEVTSGERKYNGYAHSLAGMSVQFMMFLGIELGVGLLLARRMGLWKRLRAAPLSRATLLGATVAGGALITVILMSIIFAVGSIAVGMRIDGSLVGFAGIVVSFAVLTATFGLLIAAIGKTPEATRGIAVFATLVMVMLGGAWVPSFIFPEWLQTATLIVPTRWAIDGLAAMTWRGLGLDAALAPIAVMLAFSAVFAAVAAWRFEWEE